MNNHEATSSQQQAVLRTPDFRNRVSRHLFNGFYKIFAPAEIEVCNGSIERINKLTDDGYAFLVLGTHFSKREGFDFIGRSFDFINHSYEKPFLMPISYHQYSKSKTLLNFFTRLNSITLAPIVNEDTVNVSKKAYEKPPNKVPNEIMKLGFGFTTYVHLMRKLIDQHGISGIAPQAGRRTSLEIEQAKQQPLETLLYAIVREIRNENKTQQKNEHPNSPSPSPEQLIEQLKIAIMFMPIRPMRKVDYKKIHDTYDLFRKHHIQIGPVLTIRELYWMRNQADSIFKECFPQQTDSSEKVSVKNKHSITLDEVVLTLLSFGVDPDYNKISREDSKVQAMIQAVDDFESERVKLDSEDS